MVWNYGKGQRAVRLFENGIKVLSALVVLSFAWVVWAASARGDVDWARVLWGFVPHSLPDDAFGVHHNDGRARHGGRYQYDVCLWIHHAAQGLAS